MGITLSKGESTFSCPECFGGGEHSLHQLCGSCGWDRAVHTAMHPHWFRVATPGGGWKMVCIEFVPLPGDINTAGKALRRR